jgi:CHAT domain/Lecithin:cholesterol acyltransferase
MLDEQAYVARVESADVDELAHILTRPTVNEERTLRAYLGDERYQRMHALALKRNVRQGVSEPRGNVVVIPGIMGSELTAVDRSGISEQIWLKARRIIFGGLGRLRLAEDGRSEHDRRYDIRASGILKRYYGELLLSLSESWNVRAFWYDWRKDLNIAANELRAQISGWFNDDAPVHIVSHSMGGLVARTFINNHPDRWRNMWDEQSDGRSGGRLIMLGTPNYGSFEIPRAIAGLADAVRKLAFADITHDLTDLRGILNTFVGSYQMLPSPNIMPEMKPLYDSETYGTVGLRVSQSRLDNAHNHHESLKEAISAERMVYIAGYGRPTYSNIKDLSRLDRKEAYDITLKGDGTVPHQLGILRTSDGVEIKTFYVDEEHGNLASNAEIQLSLGELLESGTTKRLSAGIPSRRALRDDAATKERAREQIDHIEASEEDRLKILVRRNSLRGAETTPVTYVSSDEREIEEILTRGFLPNQRSEGQRARRKTAPSRRAAIEIGLECDGIQDVAYEQVKSASGDPIDAIAVGHYIGVKPQAAEWALDQAISRALPGRAKELEEDSGGAGQLGAGYLLTQYSERGVIRGELAQPFFLPDPRANADGGAADRVIAIGGMGLPGRFGMPELTVLARELCWSLQQMGKRHLATVLIGAGNGNLPVRDSVSAWISGIENALTNSADEDGGRHLRRITFVEIDPYTVETIDSAILWEKERLERQNGLEIKYKSIPKKKLEPKKREERRRRQRRHEQDLNKRDETPPDRRVPTRITLSLDGRTYRFGAITESASIPEREIPLDPKLVIEANDELAGELNLDMQKERGRFLEQLLVPSELRAQFFTDAPLVMTLDSTMARIHWEMVAQPELAPRPEDVSSASVGNGDQDGQEQKLDVSRFLGTSRGFTRQLRTTFAPPPEPPPPPRSVMRVLVVADPAEDAHLPGAEEEGTEVADLFESFNAVDDESSDKRAEVVRLLGPYEARRTNVLRHLMLHRYDVLHFAGHCIYDKDRPAASGWIFSAAKDERLSANELNRIDRIPRFVFSNACESGVTPDRSEMRSDQLAPSFAEAFFRCGVSNFVCTAWPVDDVAAREFALTLYAALLGLPRVDYLGNRYEPSGPQPMHVAMRDARLSVANPPLGAGTWGAYQHYGDPYFRLFETATVRRPS